MIDLFGGVLEARANIGRLQERVISEDLIGVAPLASMSGTSVTRRRYWRTQGPRRIGLHRR
jgi:hypothetical protein